MERSDSPRSALATSFNATHSGDPSNSLVSPRSPQPNAAQQNQHARRRSYVSEEAEAWGRHTNGDGIRPKVIPNGIDTAAASANGGPWSAASLDGYAMSPHLEQGGPGGPGGFEAKLPRISDAADEDELADPPTDDDEATGLTEAARKRRQQAQRAVGRPPPEDAGGAPGLGLSLPGSDVTVMRRSVINVGLIGLWYFFSLSISIYNKWMFGKKHLDFPFPLFTTSTHMLVQFSLASLVLYLMPRFRPAAPTEPGAVSTPPTMRGMFAIVSRWFYLTRLGPCGAATGLDIGLGNMSLKFITLSFFTMCKSSALAFVLLFAFVFHLETPSWRLVLIIAAMTGGVVMMVFGEVNFDLLGFVLIIMSSFFSGFRWALTQILLLRHPATGNPFASIFLLAPIMFVSLLVLAIPIETFGALFVGLGHLIEQKGLLMGPLLLLFPGMLAFCMTAAEYALLQRTSVVTLSICGIFKEVVTISAAEIVYEDPLTPINLSGLGVTIISIGAYNYLKVQKMRRDARDKESYAPIPGLAHEESEEDEVEMYDEEERRN